MTYSKMFQGDDAKNCALRTAAMLGDTQAIRDLLTEGADVNSSDVFGTTALMCAAAYDRPDALLALLRAEADYLMKDACGCTALFHAAGHVGIDGMLTSVPNGNPAAGQRFQIATALLSADDMPSWERDREGATALHWAAGNGLMFVAIGLIDAGADMEPRDDEGRTPLMWASKSGHRDVIEFFVRECDVDTDARDLNGMTAAMHAAASGHDDVAEYLLDRSAFPDAVDNADMTADMHAVKHAAENAAASGALRQGAAS